MARPLALTVAHMNLAAEREQVADKAGLGAEMLGELLIALLTCASSVDWEGFGADGS